MRVLPKILMNLGCLLLVFELTVGIMFFKSEWYSIFVHLVIWAVAILLIATSYNLSNKKSDQS
jgi:hypothetical protein